MSASLRLSWRPHVSLSAGDGQTRVEGPGSRFALREPRPEIVDAMQRLTPPGEDEDLLAESVLSAGGAESLARWFYCVKKLGQRGLIHRSLFLGDKPLATLVPLGEPLAARNGHYATDTSTASYVLSRFAYLRCDGGQMVVESPLAHSRIVLHDPLATAIVAALAAPTTIEQLALQAGDMPTETIARLVDFLTEARIVQQTASAAPENEPAGLHAWEFHDLLFHSRSRRGRSDAPFGGTYRLAHRSPPPAVKSVGVKEGYPLDRPDPQRLERDDPPFALVQERRRSIRKYGEQPITARQLGEFLYRTARVKEQWQVELPTPAGAVEIELTSRPYPAGGGLYELEFYTAVGACHGLAGGLYHYDPVEHRLDRVAAKSSYADELLDEAAASAGIDAATLQVLIVLSARFERIAWKYESIAYSLVLKHVGVVYQTMYLVATAMGLAPCALGCGDSDLFARASGNDYYTETSVGEFLLGSRASVE